MYKKLFFIFVFLATTLTLTQFAIADYTLTNGNTTDAAWVTYSVWRPASGGWPAGWRTQGWEYIAPSGTQNLPVPQNNTWVYIRVELTNFTEIKPTDHETRDSSSFWIHPLEDFTVVETNKGEFLKSNLGRESLKLADLYKYRNGGSHTILDETDQNLPDLPAQEIYNQAIHSVVWIHTNEGDGSGVLIDKEKKFIVTNQHVTGTAAEVTVFFPYRDEKGKLQKDKDFYANRVEWLVNNNYATRGRVIAQNKRHDLAIVQLDWLPPTASEIQHDFSTNVEDSMEKGDKVHILGNPGDRLWNWTQGTFLRSQQVCPIGDDELVGCLEMEGDTHGGNSGGPVLNGQGVLIGILTAGTDETLSLAAPARNVKALLDTVPAILPPIPPPRTYPKRTFKIRNRTGVTVPYQIKWSSNNNWQQHSLKTGYIKTHWSNGQNVPSGYPKIRFDYIAGDERVTYRYYNLKSATHADSAPTYFFRYNQSGDRLDLYRDDAAAPTLSEVTPKETVLLSNYPNPFNPETWIPYKLSKPAEVTVTIYAADGRLIRTLALGHQPAGVYQSKSRAAYWDGRNTQGELVASGVYFYTLSTESTRDSVTAGDFTATRKMLIRK